MDLRGKISLSSSWEASVEPHCVLYIKNISGILLEEPYSSEREKHPILSQPSPSPLSHATSPMDPNSPPPSPSLPPCYVRLGLSHLGGYGLSSLALTSSARTMEVYGGNGGVEEGGGGMAGGEYLGTARGGFVRNTDDGFKLYYCEADLPLDEFYSEISLKLLSLRGKAEVKLDKLELLVKEDHGGTMVGSMIREDSVSSPHFDVEQLLSVLPTQNLPPFMSSLVTSLQRLQLHSTPVESHCADSQSMPLELAQLTSVLRAMRPPPPHSASIERPQQEAAVTLTNGGSEEESAATMTNGGSEEESRLSHDPQTLAAMEQRLRGYVDDKFTELQRQIDERFEQLMKKVLQKVAMVNSERAGSGDTYYSLTQTEQRDQDSPT